MIRSLTLLCALFVGDALAGNITIPTDDCTWREETYGAWNQCFGNEIVIGKPTTSILAKCLFNSWIPFSD